MALRGEWGRWGEGSCRRSGEERSGGERLLPSALLGGTLRRLGRYRLPETDRRRLKGVRLNQNRKIAPIKIK